MKAMVLEQFRQPLQMRDVAVPDPGPDEILVKMKVCSVCASDLKITGGKLPTVPLPLIPGHEIAGEVVASGKNVRDLRPGDGVTFEIYVTCGRCRNCLAGRKTICMNSIRRLGFELNGGFAEYMVAPAANAVKLLPGISYAHAAVIPDAISTCVHAFYRQVTVQPGDTALVVGCGGLGIHALQIVKHLGATVISADVDEAKLARARELGADHTVNPRTTDLVQFCREVTGGCGVDVAGDVVGYPETSEAAFNSLRMGGAMVMIGYAPGSSFQVGSDPLAMGERVIAGSRAMSREDIEEGMRLVASGAVKPQIAQQFALEEANAVLTRLATEGFMGRGVLVIDA